MASKQDLALLRSTGSTARVLNLAAVYEQYGGTEEYAARPLFRSKRLNRSILLKHTLRDHERENVRSRGSTATKIVLPFDTTELQLGGYSFFVSDREIEKNLRNALGAETSEDDFRADLDVLNVIDGLPSFDPFLLRERLKRHGYEPARCYFDLSQADAERMRTFVENEISKLVNLAFAGGAGNIGAMSRRMAEKLMTDETAQSLDPLRQTLQLTGNEYREGVFAWKGFLYYSWSVSEFAPALPELSRQILAVRILRASSEERAEIDEIRRKIVRCLGVASGKVRDGVQRYKTAYDELAAGKPTAFRDFLLKAPALFLSVGDAISIIKHVDSYWRFRFRGVRGELQLDINDAIEIFREFAGQLGGLEDPGPQRSSLFSA
ncbi:MAG TPA: hypothetical protein VG943_06920 [Caulobacterales bacterium]|nr:hypothetical protein [Caulobacterales bacterium]